SDYLNINQRFLSDSFSQEKIKLLNKIKGSYQKAPYFKEVYPLIEDTLNTGETNLFDFIYSSLVKLKEFLDIETKFIKSSKLNIDVEQYKAEEKVLAICNTLGAATYINPIGGIDLYSRENFKKHNIDLLFVKSKDVVYPQFK